MLLTGKKFFFDIIYQLSILTDGKILQRSDGGGVFDVLDKMNGQTLCGCSTVLACQVCPNTYQRTLLLQIQTLDHLLLSPFLLFFFVLVLGGGGDGVGFWPSFKSMSGNCSTFYGDFGATWYVSN